MRLALALSLVSMVWVLGCDSDPPVTREDCYTEPEHIRMARLKKAKASSAGGIDATRAAQALTFKKDGKLFAKMTLAEMAKLQPVEEFTAYDPYYKKEKSWRTIRLLPLLQKHFGTVGLDEQQFILRASDGYTVPIRGDQFTTDDAYVAFEDKDFKDWELVGNQKTSPGPFYVVWKSKEHHDLEKWPRPWQLAQIERATFEQTFPKTVPKGNLSAEASHGFEVFKSQCVRCHAINRHGGRVGPELNVPQNITEYREEAYLKAYIKNPKTFRYGNMPALEHLTDQDLDGLLAYLKVMAGQKQDDPT